MKNIEVNLIRTFTLILVCLVSINIMLGQTNQGRQVMSNWQYTGCGCNGSIKLKIYNGLEGMGGNYGGQEVIDPIGIGAVTVANLNDTDGDGLVDSHIDDNSVTMNDNGENEVDLMRLDIYVEGELITECTHIKLIKQGAVKVWETSTKGTLTPENIPIASLPKTVYIEATTYSQSVRDISISLSAVNSNGDLEDLNEKVYATAIWTIYNNYYNDRTILDPPQSLLFIDKTTLLDHINNFTVSVDNSLYGFGNHTKVQNFTEDNMVGGRIIFEYKLLPADIINHLSELGIKFDCSRRKSRVSHLVLYGAPIVIVEDDEVFPPKIEMANDDGHGINPGDPNDNLDEDEIPSPGQTEIYQYDAPASVRIGSDLAMAHEIRNYEDFTRVSFKDDIVGNIAGGSISSEKVLWHLDYTFGSVDFIGGFNPNFEGSQLLEVVDDGLTYSIPRRMIGDATGVVSLTNVTPPSDLAFTVRMTSGNEWTLFKLLDGLPAVELNTSNESDLGPWHISGPNFIVNINNDISLNGKKFEIGDMYTFSIWDVPVSPNEIKKSN